MLFFLLTYLFSDRPREYHASLLFTAKDAKYDCKICRLAEVTYREAASHYFNQNEFSIVDTNKRIAFFILDIDSARSIFNSLSLDSVPRLFILPPRTEKDGKTNIFDFALSSSTLLDGTSALLAEIEAKSGVAVSCIHSLTHKREEKHSNIQY
jgi:hypothetical protein